MTALRPERDSAAPYGEDAGYGGAAAFEAPGAYGAAGPFETAPGLPGDGRAGDGRAGGAMQAAVDGLADPLSDPLPGRRQPAAPEQDWYAPQAYAPDWSVGQNASTYAEPPYTAPQRPYTAPQQPYAQPQQPQQLHQPYAQSGPAHADPQSAYSGPQSPYGRPQAAYTGYQEVRAPYAGTPQAPYAGTQGTPGTGQKPHGAGYAPAARPVTPAVAEETVALRVVDAGSITGSRTASTASESPSAASDGPGVPGGRAARRKASKGHRRHGGTDVGEAHEGRAEGDAPVSRAAARRAAKARKPGAAVMASRAIGEVFITTGVLMLLFVTYQLYWTNIRAHAQADSAASSLQNDWANGKRNPGTFEPGQGFALLHIPKLDVVVPIAEGTDKKRVLDRGMVGHYAEEGVKTAMPDAKKGNFGLAGHRNTHGEPFRYVNRLKPGDPIVVETQDTYFVYEMASILPVTSPSNTSVLDAIPKGSTFTSAGRYITLTTCTPEFTSKYRMIVWGTMVEERARDKGKPDALVGG